MSGELLPETRDRILEGALLALGRVGLRRLTMNDVSERSGLSRGTVYRYFASKDALLAVLAEYERDRFAEGLRRALAGITPGEPGLVAVTEYIMGYLREQLPVFHAITDELLAPVMEDARPVREGRVTAAELNELLLRVVLSVFLVPGESSNAVAGVLEGALDGIVRLAGVQPRSRRSARSRTA